MRDEKRKIIYLDLRKEVIKTVLGEKEYKEIQILTDENELIASITDEDVITKEDYKVVCVPAAD